MKRFFAAATFVAAMGFVLAVSARADQAVVEGIVGPDRIHDAQSFSFTAPQTAQGEVIAIESVTGTVVQRAAADKYGRVFLAAGLPAGAYLISRGGQRQVGKIEVEQHAEDTPQRYGEHPAQSMRVQNVPQAVKLNDSFSLSGHGFSPNFADTQVTLTGAGKTETPIILAATEDQLKLAPVQQLQPGAAQLRVTNHATGQTAGSYDLLLYTMSGNLVRRAIKSGGDQTQLVITVQPKKLNLKVKVHVASGPVDFGDGHKEAEGVTNNGKATFPVYAERASGPFQLKWELMPLGIPKNADTKPTVAQVEAGAR